jgi:hypothetical protein
MRGRMNRIFDFEQFPLLETRRLLLRQPQVGDEEALFRIFSDAEVMQYYDMDAFTSIEQAHSLCFPSCERTGLIVTDQIKWRKQ